MWLKQDLEEILKAELEAFGRDIIKSEQFRKRTEGHPPVERFEEIDVPDIEKNDWVNYFCNWLQKRHPMDFPPAHPESNPYP